MGRRAAANKLEKVHFTKVKHCIESELHAERRCSSTLQQCNIASGLQPETPLTFWLLHLLRESVVDIQVLFFLTNFSYWRQEPWRAASHFHSCPSRIPNSKCSRKKIRMPFNPSRGRERAKKWAKTSWTVAAGRMTDVMQYSNSCTESGKAQPPHLEERENWDLSPNGKGATVAPSDGNMTALHADSPYTWFTATRPLANW